MCFFFQKLINYANIIFFALRGWPLQYGFEWSQGVDFIDSALKDVFLFFLIVGYFLCYIWRG